MARWQKVAKSLGLTEEQIESVMKALSTVKPDTYSQVKEDIAAIKKAKAKDPSLTRNLQGSEKIAYVPKGSGRVVKAPRTNSKMDVLDEILSQHQLAQEGMDPRTRLYVTSKRPYLVQDKVFVPNRGKLTAEQDDELTDLADMIDMDLRNVGIGSGDTAGNVGAYKPGGSPVVFDTGFYEPRKPTDMSVMEKIRAIDPQDIKKKLKGKM